MVNGKKVDFNRHLVYEDRLAALDLVERTKPGEDVDDRVVVFDSTMGNEREGDVAVVGVDSLIALGGFGVGIDGEELRGDGRRGHMCWMLSSITGLSFS